MLDTCNEKNCFFDFFLHVYKQDIQRIILLRYMYFRWN